MPLVLVALLLLSVAVPSADAKASGTVGCAEHIEGPGALPQADVARDVLRGPLTLMGVRVLRPQHPPVPAGDRVRLGIMLEAGHAATLRIAPESLRVARLEYAFAARGRRQDMAVEFRPCAAAEPRFSGDGTVGPRTIWAGGLHVRRPGCVRLIVRVDGRRLDDVRLALGRLRCPPRAGTRS